MKNPGDKTLLADSICFDQLRSESATESPEAEPPVVGIASVGETHCGTTRFGSANATSFGGPEDTELPGRQPDAGSAGPSARTRPRPEESKRRQGLLGGIDLGGERRWLLAAGVGCLLGLLGASLALTLEYGSPGAQPARPPSHAVPEERSRDGGAAMLPAPELSAAMLPAPEEARSPAVLEDSPEAVASLHPPSAQELSELERRAAMAFRSRDCSVALEAYAQLTRQSPERRALSRMHELVVGACEPELGPH